MWNESVFWIAVNKINGRAEGSYRTTSPHLYFSRGAARSAKKKYRETDEQLEARYDFIPVKLVVADEAGGDEG